MDSDNLQDKIYNYHKIFSEYFFHEDVAGKHICPDHVLILVYSGELIIRSGSQEVSVTKGEYIFLCHDVNIILEKKSFNGQPFKSTFMGFSRSFLNEFYHNLNKKKIPKNTGNFNKNIVEIAKNPYIESLYISMQPYFQWNTDPIKKVLEIKLTEAVYCLLGIDKRFFSCLFGAHTKDATLCTSEYILYPHCTSTKCLETAYLKLQDGDKTTDIYMEVGYKNIRDIIKVYDNQYGFSLLN